MEKVDLARQKLLNEHLALSDALNSLSIFLLNIPNTLSESSLTKLLEDRDLLKHHFTVISAKIKELA